MGKRYVGKDDDLRVRKTKRAIRDAALGLLREDPAHVPSAKAVIERAEINKSTFYYHYESVQDLLEQIEQEVFDDVMGRALEDIGMLADDPARFLADFGAFAYEGESELLAWNGRLKASVLDAVLSSAGESGGFPIDAGVVEVVLLGLWGFTRRVSREEYERSVPALAEMLARGVGTRES